MSSRQEPWPGFGYIAVLTAADLADRWEKTPATVISWWRQGRIPAPLNPNAPRNYKWAEHIIDAFDAGQLQAAQAVAS